MSNEATPQDLSNANANGEGGEACSMERTVNHDGSAALLLTSPLNGTQMRRFEQPKGEQIAKTAGGRAKQFVNAMREMALGDVRRVWKNRASPVLKRAAALRLIRCLENPDLAAFCKLMRAEETLTEARRRGVPTHQIKRMRPVVGRDADNADVLIGYEIELWDRGQKEWESLLHETDGKPAETVSTKVLNDNRIQITVVGLLPGENVLPPSNLQLPAPNVLATPQDEEETDATEGMEETGLASPDTEEALRPDSPV